MVGRVKPEKVQRRRSTDRDWGKIAPSGSHCRHLQRTMKSQSIPMQWARSDAVSQYWTNNACEKAPMGEEGAVC